VECPEAEAAERAIEVRRANGHGPSAYALRRSIPPWQDGHQ
jgi:hypothetical protein